MVPLGATTGKTVVDIYQCSRISSSLPPSQSLEVLQMGLSCFYLHAWTDYDQAIREVCVDESLSPVRTLGGVGGTISSTTALQLDDAHSSRRRSGSCRLPDGLGGSGHDHLVVWRAWLESSFPSSTLCFKHWWPCSDVSCAAVGLSLTPSSPSDAPDASPAVGSS
jgi:hypothetical protein